MANPTSRRGRDQNPHADPISLLAEAVLALRATADLGVAWSVAARSATEALGASDARLLRLDPRSGTLTRIEGGGVETPYRSEHGGPVEWCLRQEQPLFDEGEGGDRAARETLLWTKPPVALVTLPLLAGGVAHGFLLVSFREARAFPPDARRFLQSLADALALAFERESLRHALDDERARAARLERRLLEAHDAAAGLMAIVAHEVRSPLASIKAYAETLLANLDNAQAPRQRFVQVIDEECDRLSALIVDVHDLSRIEGGEHTLRLGASQASELVREAVARVRAEATRRNIAIRVDADSDPRVEVDLEMMRRVIANLLLNAIEFSPEGSEVRVTIDQRGDEWVCSITDPGPPLPAEDLGAVFEGFYRARRAGSSHEGTRLALAITRSLVQLHGGRLQVDQPLDAQGERRGARFVCRIPVRPVASPRARRIARALLGRDDLTPLFEAIVEMVSTALDAEIVSLALVDPDRGDLFVAAATGRGREDMPARRVALRSGVSGAVAAWGRAVRVEDIETDRRFRRLNHPQYHTKSLLCVPLRLEGEVVGVLNANNKRNGEAFDDDDLALLVLLAERISSALERAGAYPDSERVVEDALEAVQCMTRMQRDLHLGGSASVRMARALARELGLAPSEVDLLGYVAHVHDVGMVRIEAETAHPGRLDPRQRGAVLTHPEATVEILRPLEYLGAVREIVLAHHERWDGQGYPRGLSDEAIPLGARILAVVDAWESMTTARPYRAARPSEEAMEELEREAGAQFDPEVVAAFQRLLEREGEGRRAA